MSKARANHSRLAVLGILSVASQATPANDSACVRALGLDRLQQAQPGRIGADGPEERRHKPNNKHFLAKRDPPAAKDAKEEQKPGAFLQLTPAEQQQQQAEWAAQWEAHFRRRKIIYFALPRRNFILFFSGCQKYF